MKACRQSVVRMVAGPMLRYRVILAAVLVFVSGCTNDPYRPGEADEPTYFGSFSVPPTKLDPTTAYYVHEGRLIDQIYEPPFTYHYLRIPAPIQTNGQHDCSKVLHISRLK